MDVTVGHAASGLLCQTGGSPGYWCNSVVRYLVEVERVQAHGLCLLGQCYQRVARLGDTSPDTATTERACIG